MHQSVLQQFFDLTPQSVEPVLKGRINDTYIVGAANSKVVLQNINANVFPQPQIVADNFCTITDHLASKRQGYEWFQVADSVQTLSGDNYFVDDGDFVWRCQSYITPGESAELSPSNLQQLGKTLGTFHLLLADVDPSLLREPLPGFHYLPGYFANYQLQSKRAKLTEAERYCAEVIASNKERALELHYAVQSGVLDAFIIHGDPKLDNFVFDTDGRANGLIDLDTVYKGVPHIDLGDSLRSLCANSGNGLLNLSICENFLRGYFGACSELFTSKSRDYIVTGIFSVTYELGLRFFTDHLAGDTYFKVEKRGVNLDRATAQFALAQSILDDEQELHRMIAGL